MEKNVGELIDELSIVNIKIYHLEDEKRDRLLAWNSPDYDERQKPYLSDQIATITQKITALNDQRSRLKNALTERIERVALSDVKTFQ